MDPVMQPRARLESAVVAAMDAASASVMQWGVDDCALWAANIIRDVLGYDPAKPNRGRYKTRRGALRVLGAGGMLKAMRAAARRHKWKRVDPEAAQPGDVGLVWTEVSGRPVLATVICRKQGWFVGRNERGFSLARAADVAAAWSVLPLEPGARRALSLPIKGMPQPVHEPISAAIGLTALLSGSALAGFGGAIISVTLSIGFSLAASLLQPQLGTNLDSTLADSSAIASVQITERQSVPFKRVIVGTAFVGGALFFEQVKAPYLYTGILINYGEIAGIDEIRIGTNTLVFNDINPNEILVPLVQAGQPSYSTRLQVSVRYGADDQTTDPIIATDFPNLSTNLIDPTDGTTIGNMTGDAGLASAFDGLRFQEASLGATLGSTGNITGHIGKDWGSPRTVTRFRIYAPSDLAFSDAVDNTVTIRLQGSTDNFAASNVTLATVTAAAYSFGDIVDVLSGIDVTTAYRYHRVSIIESNGDVGAHTVAATEVQFFEGAAEGTEFAQRGTATAVLRYHFGADSDEYRTLWGQVARPNAYFVVRGRQVYDPRDPTQSLDDPLTWKFSNNATLVQTFYLTQDWGGRIPTSKIRWDKIAESADYDDEVMVCADGTFIPRHTIDGVIVLNQKPYEIMPLLLTANRGLLLESGGQVWIASSKPKTPVVTIYDGLLASGIKYQAAKVKREQVNKLQVRFVAPEQDYQLVDGPILSRTDLQVTDQEVLPATLALNYTQDHRRAQRLGKAFLQSARLGRTITCSVATAILSMTTDELIGNVVTFDSEIAEQANGDYLVTMVGFSDDFSTVNLALTEYDPTIETDWDPAVDEQPFELAELNTS